MSFLPIASFAGVFSVVGALRDDTKNACEGGYLADLRVLYCFAIDQAIWLALLASYSKCFMR